MKATFKKEIELIRDRRVIVNYKLKCFLQELKQNEPVFNQVSLLRLSRWVHDKTTKTKRNYNALRQDVVFEFNEGSANWAEFISLLKQKGLDEEVMFNPVTRAQIDWTLPGGAMALSMADFERLLGMYELSYNHQNYCKEIAETGVPDALLEETLDNIVATFVRLSDLKETLVRTKTLFGNDSLSKSARGSNDSSVQIEEPRNGPQPL